MSLPNFSHQQAITTVDGWNLFKDLDFFCNHLRFLIHPQVLVPLAALRWAIHRNPSDARCCAPSEHSTCTSTECTGAARTGTRWRGWNGPSYTHIQLIFMVNVSEYTIHVDPMGYTARVQLIQVKDSLLPINKVLVDLDFLGIVCWWYSLAYFVPVNLAMENSQWSLHVFVFGQATHIHHRLGSLKTMGTLQGVQLFYGYSHRIHGEWYIFTYSWLIFMQNI